MHKKIFLAIFLFALNSLISQPLFNKDGILLTHEMTSEEKALYQKITMPLDLTPPPTGGVRPIAEFEASEAVLIAYPNTFGIPVNFIKKMAEDVTVITVVPSNDAKNNVINQYLAAGTDTSKCQFLIHNIDSYWSRDFGPWFLAIDNQRIAMYDFVYNRPRPNDNAVNTALASYLSMDRYANNIKTCGGNFMDDGSFQAASTTLILEENTSYTLQQIKALFEQYMGIQDYHLLQDPQGEYIKHIDCWGKFLAHDKVLIGQVAASNSQYNLYEAAAFFFENINCPYGYPFKVYRVFTPGNSQTTPYTNSLILNKRVFVPVSGSSYDNAAIQVYQNAMPGYEIIPVAYNNWINTDALHCRTHEIADRCMLYIKHLPVHGNYYDTASITIKAEIYSYCNVITGDSVILNIKDSLHSYFQQINMAMTADNQWEATLSNLPHGDVKYYISAVDEAGKKGQHPFIGEPDPHIFHISVLDTTTYSDTLEINNHVGSAPDFDIYPIPADNKICIVLNNQKKNFGEIFDVNGNTVLKFDCTQKKNHIDISSLKPGLYFIKIGEVAKKMIKK